MPSRRPSNELAGKALSRVRWRDSDAQGSDSRSTTVGMSADHQPCAVNARISETDVAVAPRKALAC